MMIDTLESRRLMSVSLNGTTHLLTVTGTSNDDVISVKVVGSVLTVTDNGVKKSFATGNVAKVKVLGNAGADKITLDASVFKPSEIDTGTGGVSGGGDTVQGGSGKDLIQLRSDFSIVHGGAGDDTVNVFSGANGVTGDAGNDAVVVKLTSGPRENGFNGGTGIDRIDYSTSTQNMVIRNGSTGRYSGFSNTIPVVDGASADGVSGFENLFGGSGDDYILGTDGNNILRGNGGNDYAYGYKGNDKLFGGAGSDRLYGNEGNDFLQGDAGNDFLYGGAGNDSMFGNDGDDSFSDKDGAKDYMDGGANEDASISDAIDVLNSVEFVN
jgi:Ca2+-binding RTX toxin-like protein